MSDELKARAAHYELIRSQAARGPYSAWPDAEGRAVRPHSESGERSEKTHDGSIAFVDCELDDAKMDATAQLLAAAWEMVDLIRDQLAEIERLRGGAVLVAWRRDDYRMFVSAGIRNPNDDRDGHTWVPLYTPPPAPVVPVGFSRDDLEAVAEGLESEPPTVNIGPIEVGDRDTSVESSAAFAARFIRAVLAAPPPPAVPEGWKPVPMKPTEMMCWAGCEVSQAPTVPVEVWNAMLAAAPEVPR